MTALSPASRQSGRRGRSDRRERLSKAALDDKIRMLEQVAEILGLLILIGGFLPYL